MATILLVEDNVHNRTVFATILKSRGHEVICAEDGEAGLEALGKTLPDIVLLDLSLPRMDGWSVARAIRSNADPARANLTIIALTAHAMKGDRERALEAGCDGYISKPVSPRELAKSVQETLDQGGRQRSVA